MISFRKKKFLSQNDLGLHEKQDWNQDDPAFFGVPFSPKIMRFFYSHKGPVKLK